MAAFANAAQRTTESEDISIIRKDEVIKTHRVNEISVRYLKFYIYFRDRLWKCGTTRYPNAGYDVSSQISEFAETIARNRWPLYVTAHK